MFNQEEWVYDEMKQIGTDYADQEEVTAYDKRMSRLRDLNAESQEIIKQLNIKRGDIILEIGAGTGSFSLEAAALCSHVYAVDISVQMLTYASNKAKERNVENISFVHSGFLGYEHSGEDPDAVVSQLALHHLPDFWKQVALKKIFNILKPKGRFYLCDVVFSINVDRYREKINGLLDRIAEKAGEGFKTGYIQHIRDEYSTFDWIMEEMLYRTGFNILQAEYGEDLIAKYVCEKP